MSGEASLVAKWKTPEPLTKEEEAERQAAFDQAKRYSEVVNGAGINFTKKIQAEGAKKTITVKGTSTTILKGMKCLCGEKLEVTNDGVKQAGGRGGERPRAGPFAMTSKFQSLTEDFAKLFSGKIDAFGYAEALIGWFTKVGVASEFDYSKAGNATLNIECFNCRRIHPVKLTYEAPGIWPTIDVDPIEIWQKYPVNLKHKETKRALDQFAQKHRMGLARDGFEYIERELTRMKAVEGQLEPVRIAIKELDLPGSGGDIRDLETVLRRLSDRAEKAQRFFAMGWLFKAFAYMGEYYKKNVDEAEKLLRGTWRPPEWYFEGR